MPSDLLHVSPFGNRRNQDIRPMRQNNRVERSVVLRKSTDEPTEFSGQGCQRLSLAPSPREIRSDGNSS